MTNDNAPINTSDEKKSRRSFAASGIAVGSASIVMVFAVLALTVFAVLTLVTAKGELSLAKKTAQAVSDYYAADCEAAEEANGYIKDGELPEDSDVYSYDIEIDENRILCVTLEKTPDGIRVLDWCERSVSEWEPDIELDVFIPF